MSSCNEIVKKKILTSLLTSNQETIKKKHYRKVDIKICWSYFLKSKWKERIQLNCALSNGDYSTVGGAQVQRGDPHPAAQRNQDQEDDGNRGGEYS